MKLKSGNLTVYFFLLLVAASADLLAAKRGDERVIYDGDFVKSRQEHETAWAGQDVDLDERLAELIRNTANARILFISCGTTIALVRSAFRR